MRHTSRGRSVLLGLALPRRLTSSFFATAVLTNISRQQPQGVWQAS
ncbi:hypothetical protein BURCENK562V_C5355 [Burkholderia cenocepacia K56-2Valvano]|nr:hypothetical protein BURCENK562V_C5355 [Burkholderia cenocepacia K56-2Valvano]